ncbi:MAG TPA: hypothetical protein VLM43_07040 [Desulfobacterales bacterium]|nr:hypothetical protein [Desulfobacterales bacterium]
MTANKALAEHAEKRAYQRYNCEALIKWSYFNNERLFDAKIVNISKDGFSFETSSEISPNATIFTQLENLFTKNMSLSEQECLRTVSIGEVRWCQELFKDGLRYYVVGVRHSEVR